MKLRLIDPVSPSLLADTSVQALGAELPSGIHLDSVGIVGGPRSIETAADEELATPGTVDRVREAERLGYDAAVIACVGDVALEARGVVSIPVIGPGEAALRLAETWRARLSIIVATEAGEQSMRDLCKRYGSEDRLASIRWLGIPIVQLQEDDLRTGDALAREGEQAIQVDGADTLIIGCTLASSSRHHLSTHLAKLGLKAKVIDPLEWSVAYAYAAARQARRARGVE